MVKGHSGLEESIDSSFDALKMSGNLKTLLRKSGINTLQELRIQYDLGLLILDDYNKDCRIELQEICEKLVDANGLKNNAFESDPQQKDDDLKLKSNMPIGMLWKENSKLQRNYSILANYYNNFGRMTLRLLGEHYTLSRERVRQIIDNGTNELKILVGCDFVDKNLLSKIQLAADNQTEVNSLGINDEVFTSSGIAYLFAAMFPERYRVVESKKLHGAWFVEKGSDIENRIECLMDDLRYNFKPLSFDEIEQRYQISKKMAVALDGIFERSGYVTSKYNYDVICKMLSDERRKNYERRGNAKEGRGGRKDVLGLFIEKHIGKEIEFRYKTTRFNNEYVWRRVLVNGQDEWYMYTTLLSGKHVNYSKKKILEYREPRD
ncbi:hypothetical protein IKG28_01245 [Candidatus Saccharibacteria bacterium]|nr:hypothetical protein [Candidatus Saccharibacteria bacterium]